MVLMRDLLNFNFFIQGDVSPTQSELLLLCFGVIGKTPGLISHNNSDKKILSPSAITIMSWQDVTQSPLCSVVKKHGTKCAHNFLFPKSSFRIRRTTVFGMFEDSAIILDAIRWSFFTKSATVAMFISVLVDLDGHLSRHLLPHPIRLKIENTTYYF
jgi:hypothetical protein